LSCNVYKKFIDCQLTEEEFSTHAGTCPECKEAWEFEQQLASQITQFRTAQPSPSLWQDIRARLFAEKRKGFSPAGVKFQQFFKTLSARPAWQFAAAGVMLIIIVFGILNYAPRSSDHFISNRTLARVEQKEREYEQAIAELEKEAMPELNLADTELLLLYRDKIETINSQIQRCKEALAAYPHSVSIRKYLLAAYQEKKETLQEVLVFTQLNERI